MIAPPDNPRDYFASVDGVAATPLSQRSASNNQLDQNRRIGKYFYARQSSDIGAKRVAIEP
jgi:hypothetical protein